MSLLATILIAWCALSFAATGFCGFLLWRSAPEEQQSRIITEAPVDVLFTANDHVRAYDHHAEAV